MDWIVDFGKTILETVRDVVPIVATLIGFQVLVIRKPIAHARRIFFGFVYMLLGISFFLKGLEMTLFPLGELMARELASLEFIQSGNPGRQTSWHSYGWVYGFAACIGFATTLAEPALIAVALKVEEISGGAIRALNLRLAVSIGVAFGISLGTFRIVTGSEYYLFILAGYCVALIQSAFAPRLIIGLAFDSGLITTSTVTVPLVTALGIGLASTVPGRNPLVDGFGLIAFASLFPIIAVLGYAQFAELRSGVAGKSKDRRGC
ncbi:MAG: DUF1538 domain-containing protein [Methylococcaceae bacterium]|nr:DUF1538 domain-containing protein [Methylococcaceae bacterium]